MVLSEQTRQRKIAQRLARRCTHCAGPGVTAHGLCGRCYRFERAHGILPPRESGPAAPCAHCCRHCGTPDYITARGLCRACYAYERRHGVLRDLHTTTQRRPALAGAHGRHDVGLPPARLSALLLGEGEVDWSTWHTLREQVHRHLVLLDARQAFILRGHLGLDGLAPRSLATLGRALGLSRSRAHQLEGEALALLRAALWLQGGSHDAHQ